MMIKPKQSGFTLIEMIVSLGVFSIVVTVAIGALLVLVAANEQLQGEQSVMTNLSFALDSMTREIRTGTNYYCDSRPDNQGSNNIFADTNNLDTIIGTNGYQDCAGQANTGSVLHGVAFVEGGNSISGGNERILYFYNRNTGQLFRRVGVGDAVSIVSSDIWIHEADFYVSGSAPQSDGDPDQAIVTIYVQASDSEDTPVEERYNIQTSVSQRTLDI